MEIKTRITTAKNEETVNSSQVNSLEFVRVWVMVKISVSVRIRTRVKVRIRVRFRLEPWLD